MKQRNRRQDNDVQKRLAMISYDDHDGGDEHDDDDDHDHGDEKSKCKFFFMKMMLIKKALVTPFL